MTIFEYFMVLLSVMLSLALAQLVTGVGELMRARGLVRWSFGYVLWLAIGFLLVLDWWTSLWLVRGIAHWQLITLVFLLLQASTIYLYILWLVPKAIGDAEIGLDDFVLANRRLFLIGFGGYCICGGITNATVLPPEARMDVANYAILAPMLALAGLVWWSSNRWVQWLAPLAILALMIAYFAYYFRTIG